MLGHARLSLHAVGALLLLALVGCDEGSACASSAECPSADVCINGQCLRRDPCAAVRCNADAVCVAGQCEPRDAGGTDAGDTDAGDTDAGDTDAGDLRLDAGSDAGGSPGADSGALDAGEDGGSGTSCDAIYGDAPGYMLCEERPARCEFFTDYDSAESCDSICGFFGGVCLERWRDEGIGGECVRMDTSPRDCGTSGNTTDICVCTR